MEQTSINDAVLALISLGYKQVEAHKVVTQAYKAAGGSGNSEDLLRQSLKLLI